MRMRMCMRMLTLTFAVRMLMYAFSLWYMPVSLVHARIVFSLVHARVLCVGTQCWRRMVHARISHSPPTLLAA